MAASVVDSLSNAIENGDIVELEDAIRTAQDFLRQGSPNSGAVRALLSRAQQLYTKFMELCRPYVRPLRRACQHLSERDIFEALVRIHNLPANVQLHMYSDIRKAEALREDMVASQEEALRVLDSTDWRAVDKFLTESACALEDRTVLALVQKREDLLKIENRKVRQLSQVNSSLSPRASQLQRITLVEESDVGPRGESLFSSVTSISPGSTAPVAALEESVRKSILLQEIEIRKALYRDCLVSKLSCTANVRLQLTAVVDHQAPLVSPREVESSNVTAIQRKEPVVAEGSPVRKKDTDSVDIDKVLSRLNKSRQHNRTPDISPIQNKESSNSVNSHNFSPFDRVGMNSVAAVDRPSGVQKGKNGDTSVTSKRNGLEDSSASFQQDLQRRRLDSKIRAVFQEEDIHRRDIEGTEEFDRNVFLNPLFTRITLDLESIREKQSRLFVY